jgi:hypothetical protein
LHSSSGEPAELTLRPRSFGKARTLAARTFEGLRAWLSIGSAPHGDGTLDTTLPTLDTTRTTPDTTRTTVPLRISRRLAGEGTVLVDGEADEFGTRCDLLPDEFGTRCDLLPDEFGSSLPAGSAASEGVVVSGGGGNGASAAKAAYAACAAFSDVAVGGSVSGGKHAVPSWHGSSGADDR